MWLTSIWIYISPNELISNENWIKLIPKIRINLQPYREHHRHDLIRIQWRHRSSALSMARLWCHSRLDFTHLGENEPSHSCQGPLDITHVTPMTVRTYGCLEVGDFLSLLLRFSQDECGSDSLRERLDDKTYSSINTDMKYVPGNSRMKIQNANLKK